MSVNETSNWRYMINRNPYKNNVAEAYVTAINILAVEYLIKTHNENEYSILCERLSKFEEFELEVLFIDLNLNMHTSSLGAMITQGDYDIQKERLLEALNNYDEWRKPFV